MSILNIATLCLASVASCVGAYTDYKTRTVSNYIPLTIFLAGFFTGGLWSYKILGFAVPLMLIIATTAVTRQKSGGADIKMYAACGFCFGFWGLLMVLTVAFVVSVVTGLIKRRPKGAFVPMCTYLFPGVICASLMKIFM